MQWRIHLIQSIERSRFITYRYDVQSCQSIFTMSNHVNLYLRCPIMSIYIYDVQSGQSIFTIIALYEFVQIKRKQGQNVYKF